MPDLLPSKLRLAAGSGSTALVLAISNKHYATADLLLSHAPDVNRQGSGEGAAPPLHLAVADGEVELAGRLLGAGADVNAQSGSGSPLMLAAARANAPMLRLLLGVGADVGEASRKGLTPLFLAVAVGGSAECVQLLVDAGADPNARALGAFTPLHVAAESGKADIAEVLLKVGALPGLCGRRRPSGMAGRPEAELAGTWHGWLACCWPLRRWPAASLPLTAQCWLSAWLLTARCAAACCCRRARTRMPKTSTATRPPAWQACTATASWWRRYCGEAAAAAAQMAATRAAAVATAPTALPRAPAA